MANQEHVDLLKQGRKVWNVWREEHPMVVPDLRDADLNEVDLSIANLRGANLRGANLRGADLSIATLNRADLSDANLREATLFDANLSDANLSDANLFDVDLSDATLRGATLREANLDDAYLRAANLFKAKLSNANLRRANLSAANLFKAKLSNANLFRADLSEANLSSVNLDEANLDEANLDGANLSGAAFWNTSLGNVDLGSVQGLETVEHRDKSYVDIHTLYRSQGKIPEVFLRGIGAPDTFIEYVRSLTVQPIQYYSCFISYSSKDEAFVKRLYADLQNNNVRCWYAPEDLRWGDEIERGIDEAIRMHEKVLLVLSSDAVESGWVEHEVTKALEKERREKKLVLFPVRLDRAIQTCSYSWATRIRHKRNIGDFSKWKAHDIYQKQFERLLRDLKATPNIPELGQDDSEGGKGK